ncbi:MAG: LysR substrate-binding domain-containing protein [Geodermatophilaceae bacterium]
MELRSLRYFVVVAEELNFGRAAKRVYISQSGLSQSIQALERQIGKPLFERSRRQVGLTTVGEALLPEAQRLLAHADDVERLAKQLVTRPQHSLMIVHTRSAGVGLPIRLTASFRKAHPEIDVECSNGFSSLNVDKVAGRVVDAGFVRPPIDTSIGLGCEVLSCDEVLVATPADHPLADLAEIDAADLWGEPLVYFPCSAGGLWIAMLEAVYGARRPPISRVEPDESHMLAAVAERAGITLLTESSASMLNVPGVAIRRIRHTPTVPLALIWRPDNPNPALQTFLTSSLDHARRLTKGPKTPPSAPRQANPNSDGSVFAVARSLRVASSALLD